MTDPGQNSHLKPTNRPRKRLLLVDDNAEGRRALARLLELHGYEVTAVGDGASAVEVLNGFPPPDIVLTDLFLPDSDGRDVAKEARSLNPPPTVVLITGWDFDAEGLTAQAAGVDFMFLKPLNVADLVSKLNEFKRFGV